MEKRKQKHKWLFKTKEAIAKDERQRLRDFASSLKNIELFPESNKKAKEILSNIVIPKPQKDG